MILKAIVETGRVEDAQVRSAYAERAQRDDIVHVSDDTILMQIQVVAE